MSPRMWRTVVLALVLAVLIVPMGGSYQVPGLLLIAAIAAFDLWRQSREDRRR